MLLTRTAAQIPPQEQEITRNIEENDQNLQVVPGPSVFKCLFNDCHEAFISSAQLELHIQGEHSDVEPMNHTDEFHPRKDKGKCSLTRWKLEVFAC
jgi:hypothetical protein